MRGYADIHGAYVKLTRNGTVNGDTAEIKSGAYTIPDIHNLYGVELAGAGFKQIDHAPSKCPSTNPVPTIALRVNSQAEVTLATSAVGDATTTTVSRDISVEKIERKRRTVEKMEEPA